ncbi:ATP-binding protein [Alicyclobacillus fastidiosus]|uniref:ATP-binding protein n=1 Tax=Alicyclobacillus fastidiosus TaxID=392011 RepID=A0ABY6ZC07_9BACL|nr:AAA family ATPase [Alicyclobacillus fastidiosus]WAH39786.1 ATP-binding protein [Alicyclobacillus fastidiosus]GMA61036.1 hypothetical protein GCM10025859_14760 [Alicyclobacillus fastidiosus]
MDILILGWWLIMENCSVENDVIVYIISGPCGVGKSTVSKEVAQRIRRSVLLVGDDLLHVYQGYEARWEERLSLTWTNILSVTRNFIRNGWNVVIDFVVEDELAWFIQELDDMSVTLYYIVLIADENTLLERLRRRGNPEIAERSLFLLHKLKGLNTNNGFLYDTTGREVREIAQDVLSSKFFRIL